MRHKLICGLFVVLAAVIGASPVAAQYCTVKELPGCSTDNLRIDFKCQADKIIDPQTDCQVCYCATSPPKQDSATRINLDPFGIDLRLDSDKAIAQLIFLGFTTFLGIVAIVTVLIGLQAAVARANSDSAEANAKALKIMQNAIVGFVLIGTVLVIVQLVASFLGVGNLLSIVDFGNLYPAP